MRSKRSLARSGRGPMICRQKPPTVSEKQTSEKEVLHGERVPGRSLAQGDPDPAVPMRCRGAVARLNESEFSGPLDRLLPARRAVLAIDALRVALYRVE